MRWEDCRSSFHDFESRSWPSTRGHVGQWVAGVAEEATEHASDESVEADPSSVYCPPKVSLPSFQRLQADETPVWPFSIDENRRSQTVSGCRWRSCGKNPLDVGSSGKSFLSLIVSECISLDMRRVPGLDVIASAAHLPFRFDSIDCVVSVDTIEHIPRNHSGTAIGEMKRVSKTLVVIHAPVEDGVEFARRRCDIAFGQQYLA